MFRINKIIWPSILALTLFSLSLNNTHSTIKLTSSQNEIQHVVAVAWSRNGSLIAMGESNSAVKILDNNGNFLFDLKDQQDAIVSVTWSSNSTILASASKDLTINLWNINTKEVLREFTGDPVSLEAVSFDNSGSLLASAGSSGLKIWDANNGSQIYSYNPGQINALDFHPLSPELVYSNGDNAVLWNVTDKNIITEFGAHTAMVTSLKWNKEGTLIASTSKDQTAKIWDRTGIETKSLPHVSPVLDLAWSPTTNELATITADGFFHLWDLELKKVILEIDFARFSNLNVGNPNALTWSPNGQKILIGANFDYLFDFNEDLDDDELTNREEIEKGTDLYNPDSDGDGILDGQDPIFSTIIISPSDDSDFPSLVSGFLFIITLRCARYYKNRKK